MKKASLNPTGEIVRWMRQNTDSPEVNHILQVYEKKFRLSNEEYKEASKLRECMELAGRGLNLFLKPGLYYKRSTKIIYKVHEGSKQADWREQDRRWWSPNADMVALSLDVANGASVNLTTELASKIGLTTGICCVCGKHLTDSISLKTGIGPVCAKNLKKSEQEYVD